MSTSPRSILITSASGNIGQKLVPLLLSTPSTASHKIVLPTRDAARLLTKTGLSPALASQPNLVIEEGDTSNAPWVESLLRKHNVDTVLSNFSGIEEFFLTLNLWSICEAAGVKHLIYISACFDTTPEAVKAGALRNCLAAHCAIKFPAEQRLMYGNPSFTWTILAPTLFFQNDVSICKESTMNTGLFSYPMGRTGCSRVDAADIALGVLRAIEDQGEIWHGKKIAIGTRETYTGDSTAKLWTKEFGKEVRSLGTSEEDLLEFEKMIEGNAGAAWARDLALMVKQFDLDGFGMTDEQYQEQVKFLGKEANSYEDWVKKLAAEWRSELQ